MDVYIAAPYQLRTEAQALAARLDAVGIGCCALWVFDEGSAEVNDKWARIDLSNVTDADVFVALNMPGWENSGSGGRHVEFGYAVAHGKPIVLVGERTNIFHHLSSVVVAGSIDEAIITLQGLSLKVRA